LLGLALGDLSPQGEKLSDSLGEDLGETLRKEWEMSYESEVTLH
jgi:hypothetical protein